MEKFIEPDVYILHSFVVSTTLFDVCCEVMFLPVFTARILLPCQLLTHCSIWASPNRNRNTFTAMLIYLMEVFQWIYQSYKHINYNWSISVQSVALEQHSNSYPHGFKTQSISSSKGSPPTVAIWALHRLVKSATFTHNHWGRHRNSWLLPNINGTSLCTMATMVIYLLLLGLTTIQRILEIRSGVDNKEDRDLFPDEVIIWPEDLEYFRQYTRLPGSTRCCGC